MGSPTPAALLRLDFGNVGHGSVKVFTAMSSLVMPHSGLAHSDSKLGFVLLYEKQKGIRDSFFSPPKTDALRNAPNPSPPKGLSSL